MGENQVGVLLQEINKLRVNFENYATVQELEKESNKNNVRAKGLQEEIEKLRREMYAKVEKKLDMNEALKIVNEINLMKEQLSALQKYTLFC